MSLPYTYSKLYETDLDANDFFIKLQKLSKVASINKLFLEKNVIRFNINSFLCCSNKQVVLRFKPDGIGFEYEFSLESVVKISIFLVLILAFVVHGVKNLLIYPSIGIFLLYIIAIYHSENVLESIFDKINNSSVKPEEMSEQQKQWMNNPDVCPACGTKLSEFDAFCPECGLNLKKYRKAKKQPVSRTGFENYRIHYNYLSDDVESQIRF